MKLRHHLLVLVVLSVLSSASAQSAREAMQQGQKLFYEAKIIECLAAFDKVIELQPESKPYLWQRGLALYYADKFQEGREQFEVHQTVNGNDVENAAWHFLCVARIEGVEGARKHFIPIEGDSRVPMREVHQLFAGKGTADDVIKAAETASDEATKKNQLCYAHLYLGLFYEAMKDDAKAKEHMLKAAKDYAEDHYMGVTARVHLKVRSWDK
jgi:lipoprotein NlpI